MAKCKELGAASADYIVADMESSENISELIKVKESLSFGCALIQFFLPLRKSMFDLTINWTFLSSIMSTISRHLPGREI